MRKIGIARAKKNYKKQCAKIGLRKKFQKWNSSSPAANPHLQARKGNARRFHSTHPPMNDLFPTDSLIEDAIHSSISSIKPSPCWGRIKICLTRSLWKAVRSPPAHVGVEKCLMALRFDSSIFAYQPQSME